MQPLLKSFKTEFRERMLDLLWRQWTAMGVAGQGSPWRHTPLDPEALLLVSCTLARHDPRLFDAMLDWLNINGHYINVQRLRRMVTEHRFAGGDVYAAIAATISTTAHAVKWAGSVQVTAKSARPEPLFYMPDGKPLPVVHAPDRTFRAYGFLRDCYAPRGTAHPFRPEATANLVLRLRAFIGVSARCEILTYLLLNGRGSPRAIARVCGYYAATITKALAEMSDSGYVISRVEGRHRYYTLVPDAVHSLLCKGRRPHWIAWPALLSALEQTWIYLHVPERDMQSPLAQASALRRVLKASIIDSLAHSGLSVVLGDDQPHTGASLLPFFIAEMRRIMDAVEQHG